MAAPTRTKVGTIYAPVDKRGVRACPEIVERRYQFVKYAAWMYEVESRRWVLFDEPPIEVSTDAAYDEDNNIRIESHLEVSIANVASEQMGARATSQELRCR